MYKILVSVIVMVVTTFNFTGCTDNNNEVEVPNENGNNIVTAKVIEIADKRILVESLMGQNYKTIALNYGDKTDFGDIKLKDVKVGNIIVAEVSGKYTRSIPPQTYMKKLKSNEEDTVITLDPREEISGYIGEFPVTVLDGKKKAESIVVNRPIAIKLVRNEDEEFTWNIEYDTKKIDKLKDKEVEKKINDKDIQMIHYFGFKPNAEGEYTFICKGIDKEGKELKKINITINVLK